MCRQKGTKELGATSGTQFSSSLSQRQGSLELPRDRGPGNHTIRYRGLSALTVDSEEEADRFGLQMLKPSEPQFPCLQTTFRLGIGNDEAIFTKHLEQFLMHKGIQQISHFLLAPVSSQVTILSPLLHCLFYKYCFEIETASFPR